MAAGCGGMRFESSPKISSQAAVSALSVALKNLQQYPLLRPFENGDSVVFRLVLLPECANGMLPAGEQNNGITAPHHFKIALYPATFLIRRPHSAIKVRSIQMRTNDSKAHTPQLNGDLSSSKDVLRDAIWTACTAIGSGSVDKFQDLPSSIGKPQIRRLTIKAMSP